MNDEPKIIFEAETESSVRMWFGDSIDEKILWRISAINDSLHHAPFPGFVESVPAYTTLTIFYDPMIVGASSMGAGRYSFELVIDYLKTYSDKIQPSSKQQGEKLIQIPVCYGGRTGPDIEEVARYNKLGIKDLIRFHAERVYTVYMVGFLPGFPYLGGMNEKLATPRRLNPRNLVPAGSVGIAGAQTGIYPLDSPGGWQLIGRTPMRLFDPMSGSPALLSAGNRIRFSPITYEEYQYLSSDQ
ncbi:MAG: 5-oxoprolinase subunit PxpB [Chitinophagaceae bacterium]|nr:MAG: 5-oxoprolinase subunit PxpB [Chitinophagaceae bacterium]